MTLGCPLQAHAATCLAPRAFGEPTAVTPVPARMVVPVCLRTATVCVHQGSEAPPARGVRLTRPQPLLLAVQIWDSPLHPVGLAPNFHLQGGYSSGKGQGGPGQRPPPVTMCPLFSACPPGRYGKRCVQCKCNSRSSCHPSDGTCFCLAGWTGPDCSEGVYQLVWGNVPTAWVAVLWLLS